MLEFGSFEPISTRNITMFADNVRLIIYLFHQNGSHKKIYRQAEKCIHEKYNKYKCKYKHAVHSNT